MRTVAPCIEHITLLLPLLHHDDRALLDRLTQGRPVEMLARNIGSSEVGWCGLDDAGAVVTLGGIIPADSETGYVWQVAAPSLPNHKRDYLRQGRDMLALGLIRFERLTTTIKADYRTALRHARRLGFAVAEPAMQAGVSVCRCERGR